MDFREHARTTGSALRNWFVAQSYDALAVASLWLIGLLIIRVPLAWLWAVMAGAFQFIPHIGPVLGLIGPMAALFGAAVFVDKGDEFLRMVYVLILYAVIVVVDGLVLQPWLMKRTARVPIWASIVTPLVLGALFSVWGIVLSAPLLAIIYAYRTRHPSGAKLPG